MGHKLFGKWISSDISSEFKDRVHVVEYFLNTFQGTDIQSV